jgi:hypothetical protein
MRFRAVLRRSITLSVLGAALLLAACQAMFTYSPLSGLQRPPSSMTPAQRLTYAHDALASGDQTAMKNAYDAIKNDTSADAQYLSAQLGIELSGIPDVLVKIASDPTVSNVDTQLGGISNFVATNNLDPTYMVAAAAQLAAAQAAGATLTDSDMAMGAMGILLQGAQGAAWDITTLHGTASQTNAIAFLAPAVTQVASLPSGDPMKDFITQLNTYITNI